MSFYTVFFSIFILSCSSPKTITEPVNSLIIEHNRKLFNNTKEVFARDFICMDFIDFHRDKPLTKKKINQDKNIVLMLNTLVKAKSIVESKLILNDFNRKILSRASMKSVGTYSYSGGYLNFEVVFEKIENNGDALTIFIETAYVDCDKSDIGTEHFTTGYFTNFYYLDIFLENFNFKFDDAELEYGVWKKVYFPDSRGIPARR